MDDNEITALAREYGEYAANSLDYDMCSDPELRHKLVAKGNSESAQSVLEWLLHRFCLVEKEAVRQEHQEAKICRTHVETYSAQWGALTAKMAVMERLFPETIKDLES